MPIPTGGPFDRSAAAAALGAVSILGCEISGEPSGPGHIKITFSPDGTVESAVIDKPAIAGTAVGACIVERFRAVRIPAFGGGTVTVGKAFVVE
jgi:hypothetical protein